ncbi:unnamed protein product [Lampetra planeri]
MHEVGSRAPTLATGLDGPREVPAELVPAHLESRANSPAGAPRELGAMLAATPTSVAMSTAMAMPMGAAAGASATALCPATAGRSVDAAVPRLAVASLPDVGVDATCWPTSLLLLPWGRRLPSFEVAYESVGWLMEEALQALPTCLDAQALQAYRSIPPADRATLQAAYQHMAAVFEPSSSACIKFSMRRREEGESPLAFRGSLLALAQAAYPDL